jgi:hypothetical protein
LSLVKAAERRQLQEVIEKPFALDPSWNAALHMIDAQVKSSIAAGSIPNLPPGWHFNTAPASSVVLCSVSDPNAPAQLVPGPCILMEYPNRSLGTLLLSSALHHLRDVGMTPRLR